MKDLRFKIFDCRLEEELVCRSEIRNLKSEICMGCESTKNRYVDNRELDDLFEKFNLATMNRFKNFIEWNAFGVCTAIGLRLGIATSKIRQFFIYASILTMGSPVIIYMVLAFWRNIRRYTWATKRNPWYYL